MRKLLLILLVASTSIFAEDKIYTGENAKDISCDAIATATGIAVTSISIDMRPSNKWIKVMIGTMTSQNRTDLDTLMVTNNSLTKE